MTWQKSYDDFLNQLGDFISDLRKSGMLKEFTKEEWEAYEAKYFGPDSPPIKAFETPRNDEKDTAWKDPHRLDYREPEQDI